MTKMICKNCNSSFEGNFCNNCGQNSKTSRINFNYLVSEITQSIFQVNRGFFYTVKELFLKPGNSINNYISGKRIKYFKPIAFILLTSALYVITSLLLDLKTYSNEIVSGLSTGLFDSKVEENSKLFIFLDWLSKNNAYFLLFTLPFFSLSSCLAFNKVSYNYFEHFVLNIYITGQQMIIYSILSLIIWKDSITEIIPFFVGILFHFWAFYKTFHKIKPLGRVLRTLFTYVIFILQVFILIICTFSVIN